MTVIAWDGKTLVADKRAVLYGHPSTTTKIFRAPDGSLLGASGEQDTATALIAWYCDGADGVFPDNDDDDGGVAARLLVITPTGAIHTYERFPLPMIMQDKFYAIGSGRDYALAAMHLGLNAYAAVEVAIALDNGCGNGIDALMLEKS